MADGDMSRGRGYEAVTFNKGVGLLGRILCVLGYHKPEIRYEQRRVSYYTGERRVLEPSRNRDQCARCEAYCDPNLKDPKREAAAKQLADTHKTRDY